MISKPPDEPLAAPAVTTHGGRVELRLVAEEAGGAVEYAARFFVAQGDVVQARIFRTPEGRFEISCDQEAPPKWLFDFSKALLQAASRSAAKGRWPRRITRWRKAPDN